MIPILIEALKDENARTSAIDALGAIGPDAKQAIPGLQEFLKDKDKLVRKAAEEALGKIDLEKQSIKKND